MIRIDTSSARPLEDQIATALRQALASGAIRPGDDLPGVRQLAGDLGVHWNTVARAYRRLDHEGLLQVRRGRGAIAAPRSTVASKATRSGLHERFAEAIGAGVLAGLSHDDIRHLFQEALASFGKRR